MVAGRGLALIALGLLLTGACGGKVRALGDSESTGAHAGTGGGGSGSVAPASGGNTAGTGSGAGGVGIAGGVGVAGGASMAGMAGTPTTGGQAGSASSETCSSDAECELIACCERCEAVPAGEGNGFCELVDCAGPGCAKLGLGATEARCVAGRCVLSHSCNTALLIDQVVLPPCPAGEAHVLDPDGYGPCVPVTECSDVGSCAPCEEAGLFCTTIDWGGLTPTGSYSFHCVSVPPECASGPTCECMQTCAADMTCSWDGASCVRFCPAC